MKKLFCIFLIFVMSFLYSCDILEIKESREKTSENVTEEIKTTEVATEKTLEELIYETPYSIENIKIIFNEGFIKSCIKIMGKNKIYINKKIFWR